MATIKISALTAATTPLAGTELLELVQGGVSVKVAARDVAASFSTNPANILPVAAGGTGASTAAAAGLTHCTVGFKPEVEGLFAKSVPLKNWVIRIHFRGSCIKIM